jgi:hypothetical protein
MSITLLYGCAQVETTVGDLAQARAFMVDVLGGGPIEQEMAAEITALFPPGDYAVEHFECGEGLFQVNAPSPQANFAGQRPVHQAYLDRIGPCVTNLNYYVDDAVHARDLLAGMGAPTYIEGPSNLIPSLADYGPENTREDGGTRSFYFLGARELIGFDLELMEPNFKRFTRQTAQHPCFVHPRPVAGDGALQLLRLRLVVRDLDATYDNLVRILAPASRSKPYDVRQDALARTFRIGLGGLELEYCQPLSAGTLQRQLDAFGPGVVAVDFAGREPEAVLARARRRSIGVGSATDVSVAAPVPTCARRQIASRHLVGFDVGIEPPAANALA